MQYKIQNTLAAPFIENYKKENYENLLTKNSRQKYKKAKKTREKIIKIYKQIYTSKNTKKHSHLDDTFTTKNQRRTLLLV